MYNTINHSSINNYFLQLIDEFLEEQWMMGYSREQISINLDAYLISHPTLKAAFESTNP